jgi:hypothetical protein
LARPLCFHEQDEQGYGGEPHGVFRPFHPYHQPFHTPKLMSLNQRPKMAEAGRTSPIKALFLSACRVAHHRLTASIVLPNFLLLWSQSDLVRLVQSKSTQCSRIRPRRPVHNLR